MKRVKIKRCRKKILTPDVLALKELRIAQNLTLKLASERIGLSPKGLGAIENGRVTLSEKRIKDIIAAYDKSFSDFIFIKRVIQKERIKRKKRKIVRTVLSNKDRRSYQRIITKESKALQALRKLKKITQDNASYLCGYPRSTIGHIENGRIELTVRTGDILYALYRRHALHFFHAKWIRNWLHFSTLIVKIS